LGLILVCAFSVFAQEIPAEENDASSFDEPIIELPEAEVSAERDNPDTVTREEMDRNDAADLWEAVRDVPGVVLSGGGRRNDSNFSVRGFGADSVPVYVDGIPLANPYRGEGDSARILTGDLESIDIQKGYSSELLGANALGGTVLMRIAKPKKPLEALVKTTVDLDSVFQYASVNTVLKAGTKQNHFYGLGVLQFRNTDHFRLPGSFEPVPGNPQVSGNRLWSDSEDLKVTLMAGLTPTADLDIWGTYVFQKADKGFSPPETGASYVIWEWPFWNRHSVSLNGTFNTGKFLFGGLLYFDKYDNRLDEYYNWNAYKLGIHAPHSDYDEYSLGGRLTGAVEINDRHRLDTAFTWKLEDHRGLRGNIGNEDMDEVMHVRELTLSGGIEYVRKLKALTVRAGAGFDILVPLAYRNDEDEFQKLNDAGYYIVKTRDMLLYTWQLGFFYEFLPDHELHLSYARKNHFPTMAQRYSTRFGSVLPNSRLGPETANHFELGYRGFFTERINFHAAGYFSIVGGKMATVQIPDPNYPSALVDYTRNLDSVSFYGLELAPELLLSDYFSAGLAFSWNGYSINHSQAGEQVIPYYPALTLNGYMVIHPWFRTLSIIPRFEYTGSRYADTEEKTMLPGYALFHVKLSADIGEHFSVSAAVDNVFDTLYEIRRYSPQAGRGFSLTMEVRY
jgi:iron complex outermembrane receptor protein